MVTGIVTIYNGNIGDPAPAEQPFWVTLDQHLTQSLLDSLDLEPAELHSVQITAVGLYILFLLENLTLIVSDLVF